MAAGSCRSCGRRSRRPTNGVYIALIKANGDAIYAGFGPTNGQRFLKQYKEFGLKLPVLGMVTTTEESSLKSMGDEALGVITAGTYSAALDTPTNWFVARFARGSSDRTVMTSYSRI